MEKWQDKYDGNKIPTGWKIWLQQNEIKKNFLLLNSS
jgi:hypothetical protein